MPRALHSPTAAADDVEVVREFARVASDARMREVFGPMLRGKAQDEVTTELLAAEVRKLRSALATHHSRSGSASPTRGSALHRRDSSMAILHQRTPTPFQPAIGPLTLDPSDEFYHQQRDRRLEQLEAQNVELEAQVQAAERRARAATDEYRRMWEQTKPAERLELLQEICETDCVPKEFRDYTKAELIPVLANAYEQQKGVILQLQYKYAEERKARKALAARCKTLEEDVAMAGAAMRDEQNQVKDRLVRYEALRAKHEWSLQQQSDLREQLIERTQQVETLHRKVKEKDRLNGDLRAAVDEGVALRDNLARRLQEYEQTQRTLESEKIVLQRQLENANRKYADGERRLAEFQQSSLEEGTDIRAVQTLRRHWDNVVRRGGAVGGGHHQGGARSGAAYPTTNAAGGSGAFVGQSSVGGFNASLSAGSLSSTFPRRASAPISFDFSASPAAGAAVRAQDSTVLSMSRHSGGGGPPLAPPSGPPSQSPVVVTQPSASPTTSAAPAFGTMPGPAATLLPSRSATPAGQPPPGQGGEPESRSASPALPVAAFATSGATASEPSLSGNSPMHHLHPSDPDDAPRAARTSHKTPAVMTGAAPRRRSSASARKIATLKAVSRHPRVNPRLHDQGVLQRHLMSAAERGRLRLLAEAEKQVRHREVAKVPVKLSDLQF